MKIESGWTYSSLRMFACPAGAQSYRLRFGNPSSVTQESAKPVLSPQ